MPKRLLLVRHAERPPIPPDNIGYDLSITPQGHIATTQFAQALPAGITTIKTSPVLRCVQTAQIIAATLQHPHPIEHWSYLGEQSFLGEDLPEIWRHWREKSQAEFRQHLLSAEHAWSGFRDFKLALADIKQAMIHELRTMPEGMTLWVTHDVVIATIASRLLPERLTLAQWPQFLGTLEVSLDSNEQLALRYFADGIYNAKENPP